MVKPDFRVTHEVLQYREPLRLPVTITYEDQYVRYISTAYVPTLSGKDTTCEMVDYSLNKRYLKLVGEYRSFNKGSKPTYKIVWEFEDIPYGCELTTEEERANIYEHMLIHRCSLSDLYWKCRNAVLLDTTKHLKTFESSLTRLVMELATPPTPPTP